MTQKYYKTKGLFLSKYEDLLEAQNTLNDSRPLHNASRQSNSLNKRQSLTEPRVICAEAACWRKPTRHLSAVVLIGRNNRIKMIAAVDRRNT